MASNKVSIVVATYNTEAYLDKCISSIINQSHHNLEIILVNDGSTDNSLGVMQKYSYLDSRIRVLDTENHGVAYARNLGMNHATGDFIMFIDSDDWLDKDMVSLLLASLLKHQSKISVCNLAKVFGDTVMPPFFNMPKNEVVEPLANNCAFIQDILAERIFIGGTAANKLYLLRHLRESGVVFEDRESIYAEDTMFLYKLLPYTDRISIVDLPLYFYVQRSDSESYSYKENLLGRWKNLIESTKMHYEKLGFLHYVEDSLKSRCASFMVEMLYNEASVPKGYDAFMKVCKNEWLKAIIKDADISHFSKGKKLANYLFRRKLYSLMYVIFSVSKYRLRGERNVKNTMET